MGCLKEKQCNFEEYLESQEDQDKAMNRNVRKEQDTYLRTGNNWHHDLFQKYYSDCYTKVKAAGYHVHPWYRGADCYYEQFVPLREAYYRENKGKPEQHRNMPPMPTSIHSAIETALSTNCFSFKNSDHKFRFCHFESITQQSLQSGETWNLGSNFKGWSSDNNSINLVSGTDCGGFARSTTVEFSCGSVAQVISVSEPKICRYILKMELPEACSSNT